uniref:Uncharacterized protein n=1 Tax=Aegilops tauschii subsp. strangulata TaxID=200361 RepID=A0A452XW08_AEGTS
MLLQNSKKNTKLQRVRVWLECQRSLHHSSPPCRQVCMESIVLLSFTFQCLYNFDRNYWCSFVRIYYSML